MSETILNVQKRLPEMSDEELQSHHDDITADIPRFMQHVGIRDGAAFIAAMILEMVERKMEISDDLPTLGEESATTKALALGKKIHEQIEEGLSEEKSDDLPTPQPLTRAQRRAMKSKKGARFSSRGR